MDKHFSEAAERNKGPILNILKKVILPTDQRLLEIGSGTGQHAVYFAQAFPRLEWHPTDLSMQLPILETFLKEAKVPNIRRPLRLDVGKDDFPKLRFDLVFTANTLHVMHWKDCKSFMKLLGHRLREGARAVFYGPFKYDGKFTSQGDQDLDQQLKTRDPLSGIRSFEDIYANMVKNGFELIEDHSMPANNRMLIFSRLKFEAHK